MNLIPCASSSLLLSLPIQTLSVSVLLPPAFLSPRLFRISFSPRAAGKEEGRTDAEFQFQLPVEEQFIFTCSGGRTVRISEIGMGTRKQTFT